jgi:prolyl oligopeptidase
LRKIVLSALLLTVPGLLQAAADATRIAGVAVPPPLPAKPVIDTYHGVEVVDPYRQLEDPQSAEVQAWLRAQADATAAILARIPGRATLLERMAEIEGAAGGVVGGIVRSPGERLFFLRRDPGEEQFKLVWREGIDGRDTVLVDPEALTRAAGRPLAIMDFAPSPDGRLLAYSIQVGGGEIGTLHVIDVASSQPLLEPIDRIRYASVSWLEDGSGFFYSRLREGYESFPRGERFHDRTRHFRSLGEDGADRRVFSASLNADLRLPPYASPFVFQVPGTQLAAAWIALGVERNGLLYLADLEAATRGTAQWRPVVASEDQVSSLAFSGGWLYLRSARDAPRFKILRLPLDEPDLARAETVVAAGTGVVAGLAGARDGLYFTRREGATLTLARVANDAAATIQPIALPVAGNVSLDAADTRLDGVVLGLGGWTRVEKPYLYRPEIGAVELSLAAPGAFDAPDDIMAREVMVRSHDGVEVPVSILSRTDIKLDGRNPTILYGYGAYGLTEDPGFGPRIYAWLERGGVYAIAHVRGGGAFGDEWRLAGRKQTKPNTWKDAIAAAEWLIANGYTAPDRIGISGGSAGGILVGRAITERPQLFAAAVPSVGVLDTLRKETSANGPANIPEYGTVADAAEFKALLAMSSYHHVRDGEQYPAVMLAHGVNDIRVDVWQSAKFASRLAAATRQRKPVLLRLDYESGHGQGSTRAQGRERTGDLFTFMLWQFGVPEFQPRVAAEE